MSLYYLDASAWVKRYVEEVGSDWMRRFWRGRFSVACSIIGELEVLSAIVRRSQRDTAEAATLAADLKADCAGFYEVSVSPQVVSMTADLIRRHRLCCADAIHLASAIVTREHVGEPVCMVASDAELLAAANAEGLATLDPQVKTSA